MIRQIMINLLMIDILPLMVKSCMVGWVLILKMEAGGKGKDLILT
jgi:hypothetical protein